MRAIVWDGSTTTLRDVDLAPPGPGEVRVKIAAAGVCHSDLHVVRGDWSAPTPVVLGHEGSGWISELGPNVDGLAVGDPVVLSWIAPCGKCRHCVAGREARCEVANLVVTPGGVLTDGTSRLSIEGEPVFHYLGVSSFAEEAIVPATGAVKVRDDTDLAALALVGCAIATGVGAVRNTAGVEAGSTVVVIGCGGVGLSIVQGARLADAARIIAVDLLPAKTDLALQLGATDAVVASQDPVAAVRQLVGENVDYAFDAIGHPATSEQAIAMLGLGGAAVVVGLPRDGQRVGFDSLILAEADQRILGSNYGGTRPGVDIPRLVDDVVAGRILLEPMISSRRPLDDAASALAELAAGTALRTLLIP